MLTIDSSGCCEVGEGTGCISSLVLDLVLIDVEDVLLSAVFLFLPVEEFEVEW